MPNRRFYQAEPSPKLIPALEGPRDACNVPQSLRLRTESRFELPGSKEPGGFRRFGKGKQHTSLLGHRAIEPQPHSLAVHCFRRFGIANTFQQPKLPDALLNSNLLFDLPRKDFWWSKILVFD